MFYVGITMSIVAHSIEHSGEKPSCERGQALLEAVLIIPLLLFILTGMFAVGQWFEARQVTAAAAREGARVGAQTGEIARIEEAVRQAMQGVDSDPDKKRIHLSFKTDPNDEPGSTLTVEVNYILPIVFSFFKSAYGDQNESYPFSLATGRATTRLETAFNPDAF